MTTTPAAALNLLAASAGLPDVLTTGAVTVACAVLSVFVVSRRSVSVPLVSEARIWDEGV